MIDSSISHNTAEILGALTFVFGSRNAMLCQPTLLNQRAGLAQCWAASATLPNVDIQGTSSVPRLSVATRSTHSRTTRYLDYTCIRYMIVQSPSCCLTMRLREMTSLGLGAPPRPARFKSSSLSRAFGKSWAKNGISVSCFHVGYASCSGYKGNNLPAALQYHLLASSRLA